MDYVGQYTNCATRPYGLLFELLNRPVWTACRVAWYILRFCLSELYAAGYRRVLTHVRNLMGYDVIAIGTMTLRGKPEDLNLQVCLC